jgi:CheY-like chemotaxis protein/HPt (histidine-containing phosphotransfer) domain-containing protein
MPDTFVLPLKKKKDQLPMTNQDITSEIDKKPRILVADDTEVNQKIAQLMLQKAGYQVDVVGNGQEALETCRQNRYDLILMDIQMPVMDGHEATKRIRKWESEKEKSEVGMRPSTSSGETKSETESREVNTDVRRQMTDNQGQKTEVGSGNREMGMQNKNGRYSDLPSAFRIPTSDFKKVPIIAMTGSAGPGGFDETLYPGMNDCLGKPLQRDYLLAVVQKWIGAEPKTHLNENPADEAPAMDKRPANNSFPLDLERAIQEFMGRKDILLGVLQNFSESAASRIDTIRRAVKGADYSVIGSEAHAIKGAAANLSADALAHLAFDLERAADKQQADLTAELAAKLEREFDILKQYVQQLPDV